MKYMNEEIINVVEEEQVNGILFQILECKYEYGTHYVFAMNGEQGFHSTDFERVQNYMKSITDIMK